MIITVCIVAVLASVAVAHLRDYTRRAKISEVVLGLNGCKNMVSENYVVMDSPPDAGRWGCEGPAGGNYAGTIQTSADGVIRVPIDNLDRLVNGRYIYLIPAKPDGDAAMRTPDDLGRAVRSWICGSDWQPVRNGLPANCRADTTTFASQEFQ
ncbi:MAG TPA: pilin [Ramlibacter sp.]|uniref:pilin n=1 Tax=Ramlibacter sp. TaxID=1917967 RepID=UPI002D7F4F7F|nr:pilin [Ramlibacter sp.]HET8744734.1 pilin [Ramlibacter sp.]